MTDAVTRGVLPPRRDGTPGAGGPRGVVPPRRDGTPGAGGPRGVVPPRRNRLVLETVLVLAVGLGQSAVYSILRIIERLTREVSLSQQTSSLNVSVTPDRPWLDLAYQVTNLAFGLAPPALALFLLTQVRPFPEGVWRGLGLDPGQPGRDVRRGVALFAAIGVPGLGLYLGARALGLNTQVQAANLGEVWWTVPVLVAAAAVAAISEEVVMIGYLFTRWRQARWTPWVVVVTSAVVRGSYHLYQGFGGFVGNLVMGVIFGLVYLRTRRVMPLVIAHFLLDVASFVGYSLLAGRVSWL